MCAYSQVIMYVTIPINTVSSPYLRCHFERFNQVPKVFEKHPHCTEHGCLSYSYVPQPCRLIIAQHLHYITYHVQCRGDVN